MWGGGGMWARSDVTSGRNRRWEWRPDAGDAEDGKTTSDASGRGARASDVGLIFADGNDPDEPLPLGEMVPLLSDRDVRIWWLTNMLNEPMDLLFYGHRQTEDDDETPSPVSLSFSRGNNRGPSPDKSQSSDDSSEDGMNPESSAAAAKRDTRSTRTNSMKKT